MRLLAQFGLLSNRLANIMRYPTANLRQRDQASCQKWSHLDQECKEPCKCPRIETDKRVNTEMQFANFKVFERCVVHHTSAVFGRLTE